MTKKQKKELSPKIEEMKGNIDNKELMEIGQELKNYALAKDIKQDDSADTFFRNVVQSLYSRKDISTKTEYLNVIENYIGTKLDFLSLYGNMPFLNKFINIFETKRVSLNRKGRQEIIMALQEKRQEEMQQRTNNLKNIFGIG